MGRWATAQKRGSAAFAGSIAAPISSDWSVAPTAATTANINRLVAVPAGADGMGRLLKNSVGTVIGDGNPTAATPLVQGGLISGQTFYYRIAWYRGTVRVSEWSDEKSATQP